MFMKKAISIILSLVLVFSVLAATTSCQSSGGGTTHDGEKDPIHILYSKDFTQAYLSYDEATVSNSVIGATIEELSGGVVRSDDVSAYIQGDGKAYSIRIPAGEDAKRSAGEAANAYLESLTDMQSFMQDAPVRYRSDPDENRDVLVVCDVLEEDGEALVGIFVFSFVLGSVETVRNAASQGHSGDPGQDPGKDPGQDPGQDPGTETGSTGGTTKVSVWNIDENGGKDAYLTYDLSNGEYVDLVYAGEGWVLYTDPACTKPADYKNGICAQGGEINLYRYDKDHKDYVGVTFVRYYTDRFGKDGYFDIWTMVYKRGELATLYSDVLSNYGGEDLMIYEDFEKTKPLDREGYYPCTESVRLYAFCVNRGYTCYDVCDSNGNVILTQAMNYVSLGTENEEYHSETVNIRGTVIDTSLDENATSFRVKDVKTSKIYAIAYCYNGHVVKTERWFFEDDFAVLASAENEACYTGPDLSTHTSVAPDDAAGLHHYRSNVTVYQPLPVYGEA